MLAPVSGPAAKANNATVAPTHKATTGRASVRWTMSKMLTIRTVVMATSMEKPYVRDRDGTTEVGAAPATTLAPNSAPRYCAVM